MSDSPNFPGRCGCGHIEYAMQSDPLFVHCCHCTWCQRETGTAFALNALIESERVKIIAGNPQPVQTHSASGKGQVIVRCPKCQIALWSHYGGAGDALCFVRVGTLANAARFAPDIHIYTARDSLNNAREPRCESKSSAGRRSPERHSHSMAEGCNAAAGDLGRNPSGRRLRSPPAALDVLPRAQAMTCDARLTGELLRCRRGHVHCSGSP